MIFKPHQAGGRSSSWLDMFAIGASAVCLAHCLMLPLLFALLPAASRLFAVPEALHIWAFALAIPASALAMRAGYRHHGIAHPALLGLLGLILLGVGALGGLRLLMETGFTVMGSVLLAIGHLSNWRLRGAALRSRSKCCNVVTSHDSGDCRCS